MNKRLKKLVKSMFTIIIIACFIVFIMWFLENKEKNDNKPNIPSTPNIEKPNKEEDSKSIEPKTYLNKITYDVQLDKKIEDKIVEYMDLYYKSMKELKEYDMTYLFSNDEQANINQAAVSLLIEIRKLKPNDLKLSSALYDLNIEKVEKNSDTIKVIVRESNCIRFNFMKDIESKVYDIENEFTFKLINDEYKIIKYNKVQDFYVMITNKYSSGGKIELDKIKQNYLDLINKKESQLKIDYNNYLKGEGINRKTCDHPYDRTKAYDYAIKWVNKRNSDWTKFNSNCQNYASQVVYNGGVPMDYSGNAYNQWKNYSSSYNESETPSGLVYTWTYVPYFYDYVKNNKGYGLCGDVNVNLYYAEAGDIIHVGITAPTKHALVVLGPYKKDDKVVDILVNSNTVDLENYPISAYVYPYVELIKIYGWNE